MASSETIVGVGRIAGHVSSIATSVSDIDEDAKGISKATGRSGILGTLDSGKNIFTETWNTIKGIADTWGKISQASAKFAKTIGTSVQGMEALRKGAIDLVAKGSFAAKYNVSAEELIGMASTYKSRTGRNIALDSNDLKGMAAMSSVFGDQGAAAEFGAELQNYGISLEKSSQIAGRMFKEAGKYGVSFEKSSKNFRDNIRIAQSFSFKNGVRDLETMARRSAEIKLDMQNIVRFSEKLVMGGIQGAVETGAKLQVLGGSFSRFSDPLQMLNEGLNDPKALMDRFVNMTKGLGYYNAKTGEFATSTFDKMRLRAATEAMGMDYNQVMESVNAQAKSDYVRKQINQTSRLAGLSEEDKAFLANTANVKNGEAEFSYIDSRTKEIVTASTSTITKEFLEQYKLQNQSDTDNIEDIAVMLRGWDDVIMGTEKQIGNTKAQIVETAGIGKAVMNIAKQVGTSNFWLKTIAYASIAGSVISLGVGAVRNIKNFGGGIGKIFGSGNAASVGGAPGTGTPGAPAGGGGPTVGSPRGAGTSGPPTSPATAPSTGGGGAGTVPPAAPAARGTVNVGNPVLSRRARKMGAGSGAKGTFGGAFDSKGNKIVVDETGKRYIKERYVTKSGKVEYKPWVSETGEKLDSRDTGKLGDLFRREKLNKNIASAAEKGTLQRTPSALSRAGSKIAGAAGKANSWRLANRGTNMVNASKFGAKGIGKIAGKLGGGNPLGFVAGAAGMTANYAMSSARASGKIKAGSTADFLGSAGAGALEYIGIANMIPPGVWTPFITAGAAIAGAARGIYKAEGRRRERVIAEKLGGTGIAEGRYTNRELKKITKYIESGGKKELSDKLKKKMEESGDSHIFEKVKALNSENISANSLNSENSTIQNAQIMKLVIGDEAYTTHAAGGGVVKNGTPGVDTELYKLSKNEVVLNPEQQANAFFNIANIKPRHERIGMASGGTVSTRNESLYSLSKNEVVMAPEQQRNFTTNVADTTRVAVTPLSLNGPSLNTNLRNISAGDGDYRSSNIRFGDRNSTYMNGPVSNTSVSPSVRSSSTRFGDRNSTHMNGPINNTSVSPSVSNTSIRFGDVVRNSTYRNGPVSNTSVSPSVSNTSTRFGDVVRNSRGGVVNTFSTASNIQSVMPTPINKISPREPSLSTISTVTNNNYDGENTVINGQSFVRDSSGTVSGGVKVKPVTEITPRIVDIAKVLPMATPPAPPVMEHKLSDIKISLDVNGSGNGNQDFGKLLAEELRKNPILLHNLANKISEQIGITEDVGRVVRKFTLT